MKSNLNSLIKAVHFIKLDPAQAGGPGPVMNLYFPSPDLAKAAAQCLWDKGHLQRGMNKTQKFSGWAGCLNEKLSCVAVRTTEAIQAVHSLVKNVHPRATELLGSDDYENLPTLKQPELGLPAAPSLLRHTVRGSGKPTLKR